MSDYEPSRPDGFGTQGMHDFASRESRAQRRKMSKAFWQDKEPHGA